jgi:hypothetical protein
LEELYLFLWGYFLVCVLGVLLIKILAHLIAHLLQLDFNLLAFFLYHFLELFVVVGFLSKPYSLERVAIKFKELKSQLYVNANMSHVVYHYFLYVQVFKSIRVSDQLRLVVDPLLVRLKFLGTTTVAARAYVIDTLWGHSSGDQAVDKCDSMRGPAVNCDVLRLFLAF